MAFLLKPWDAEPDVYDYYDEDIVDIINPPQIISSRKIMLVPEMAKYNTD